MSESVFVSECVRHCVCESEEGCANAGESLVHSNSNSVRVQGAREKEKLRDKDSECARKGMCVWEKKSCVHSDSNNVSCQGVCVCVRESVCE